MTITSPPEAPLINGRYLLLEKVGEGTTAEVFHARHVLLQRDVALKFFRTPADEKHVPLRFLDEARAIARLNHPHILQVYDCDQTPQREFFMAMEYLPNGDLRTRLRMRAAAGYPFTLLDVVTIIRSVARGLAYTHTQGIIHRDIKPSNVFFAKEDRVVIGDFGLAARISVSDQTMDKGRVAGTPAYMAPEQIQSRPVDARTDVYGLGGLMYHLLTGMPPYNSDILSALFEQHLHAPLPDPRAAQPQLPALATEIIRRCLAKDPRDRYPSMIALITDLDRLDAESEDQELTLFLPSAAFTKTATGLRSGKFISTQARRRGRIIDLLVLVGVVLAVLAGSYFFFGRGAEEETPAPAAIEIVPATGDDYLVVVGAMVDEDSGVDLGKLVADRLDAGAVKLVLGEQLRVERLAVPLTSEEGARALAAQSNAAQVIWALPGTETWTVTVTAFGRDAGAATELQMTVVRGDNFAVRAAQEAAPLLDFYVRFLLLHDLALEDDMYGTFYTMLTFREMTALQAAQALSPYDRTVLDAILAVTGGDYAEADRLATTALTVTPEDQALYIFRWAANSLRGQFSLAEREALRIGELLGGGEYPEALLVTTYFLSGATEKLLASGQGLRGSPTRTAGLALGQYYLVLFHEGDFRALWEEGNQPTVAGDLSGVLLLLHEVRGDKEAVAALLPDYLDNRTDQFTLEANRFFQQARPDSFHPVAFVIGGFQQELAGETLEARLTYQIGLAASPKDYLLNWRQGEYEAARGNIVAAYDRLGRAAENAPVPFPIARFRQVELALANPTLLPDVPVCAYLRAARRQALTDTALYAALLPKIEAAGAAADCG